VPALPQPPERMFSFPLVQAADLSAAVANPVAVHAVRNDVRVMVVESAAGKRCVSTFDPIFGDAADRFQRRLDR